MQILTKTTDALDMPILGDLYRGDNIKLLQMTLEEEKRFNDATVTIEPLLRKYKENGDKYRSLLDASEHTKNVKGLYEYDKSITFFDVDVFRQPALTFKETGSYCPYDPEFQKDAYYTYWETIDYRMKNGMTAYAGTNEDGKPVKVWIPGKHYGFLNFAPINRVADSDDEVDNEKHFIDNIEDDELAAFKLESLLKQLDVRDVRTAKKTIDFPDFFDGQYHLIMYKYVSRLLGKNCFFGKARRKGMSYYNSWDLFDDINLNPYISVILAAHDKKYLTQGKGLMRMLYAYSDFVNQFTVYRKGRLIKSKEHLKLGYKLEGSDEERGYLSEAIAVSAMNNPDVTIGKDAFQLAYEEMGKFPNWKESYNVTTSTAEAGDYKTGHICGWGTGGTEEANWEAFESVCYDPITYDCLPCNNIWDSNRLGSPVAYFYAHVHGLEGHMDYNGNTNFDTAWASHTAKKDAKRESLGIGDEFEKWCGQRANSPQEAFAKSSTNIFPRDVIILQLERIEREPALKHIAREGKLVKFDGRIKLVTNLELKHRGEEYHVPVYDYPLKKGSDVHGCFVEWQAPWRDPKSGKIPSGMYVAFQDPYAHDKDKKNLKVKDSLGTTYIYENINKFSAFGGGIPVASLIGRPSRMDDYNAHVALALEYYNCKLMFENDRGDVKPFMQARKLLQYLYEEPELQFAADVSGKTGRGYGMHMTDRRIAKGAIYLRDLLTELLPNNRMMIEYVFDTGFLNELLRWEPKGNFDRVSAWLIGTYIIKELETVPIVPASMQVETSLFNRIHF